MAGIETPLSERALKQLNHPKINMFGRKPWDVVVSRKLNMMSDTRTSVPALFNRKKLDI